MIKIYDENNVFVAELKYDETFFSNYSKHSHDMLNLTAIKEGEINIDFHSFKSEVLKPNELAVFNPHQVHLSRNISKNALGYYVLYLDVDWCLDIQKNIFENLNRFYPIDINILNSQKIYEDFLDLCNNIIKKENVYMELESFISDIFRKYAKKEVLKVKNLLSNEIKEYILNNKNEVRLDDIVSNFSYSKEHIIRVFKKEFGLSPHAFIVNVKVNKARNKLNNTDNSNLTDIAYDTGFYDQSHFNKNFKKVYAVSPRTYRPIK
ncbi:MAG TPA: AraC family transcriptional regulator [Arcobacter sp.]|nr:AraC family transcriptional regulator [Arcobacter sp.]